MRLVGKQTPKLSKAVTTVKNTVTNAVNTVKNFANKVTNTVKAATHSVVNTVKNIFTPNTGNKNSYPLTAKSNFSSPGSYPAAEYASVFTNVGYTPAQNPTYTVKTIGGKPTLVPAHFDNPTAAATSFVKERGCDPSKAKAAKQNEEGWFTNLTKKANNWLKENEQLLKGIGLVALGATAIAIAVIAAPVVLAGATATAASMLGISSAAALTASGVVATSAAYTALSLGIGTAVSVGTAYTIYNGGKTIAVGGANIQENLTGNNTLRDAIGDSNYTSWSQNAPNAAASGAITMGTLGMAFAPTVNSSKPATNSTKPAAEQTSEGGSKTYQYNMVENPGPLAELQGQPAKNFFSGKYNTEVLKEDKIYYRAGQEGKPLGQWFTSKPAESVAKVRIDTAVKSQWIDPVSGELTGTSIIDTNYAIKIPAGTTVYTGPVGNQGGVYLGGSEMMQTFIETPWKLKNIEVVGQTPLK